MPKALYSAVSCYIVMKWQKFTQQLDSVQTEVGHLYCGQSEEWMS